jgi:hypothetical protein
MSAFDRACRLANTQFFGVMADPVEIDGDAGTAVVVPESNMVIGGGVQLYNGAHLVLKQSQFPGIAVNSEVLHEDIEYVILELDDVDSSGVRMARMARK